MIRTLWLSNLLAVAVFKPFIRTVEGINKQQRFVRGSLITALPPFYSGVCFSYIIRVHQFAFIPSSRTGFTNRISQLAGYLCLLKADVFSCDYS